MPPQSPEFLPPHEGPSLVVYAQTFHDEDGNYHSLLPLITEKTGITHVIVAAIHINEDPEKITLNDHPPDDPRFNTLWGEVKWLQGSGVKVLAMLGGAAKGSYERLTGSEEQFERYFLPLQRLIRTHSLSGLDLDIEEPVPLSTPTRLITRLRTDFGADFLITMAPVATALLPDPNIPPHLRPPRPMLAQPGTPNALHKTLPHLSGFSYPELECSVVGREIAWYNTQFYCGWGDARSTAWYDAIIAAGWLPERVVLGVVTNPRNGAGFLEVEKLRDVVAELRRRYAGVGKGFGGVMGWEYFNCGDCEEDLEAVTEPELGCETVRAGWVSVLGRVLRTRSTAGAGQGAGGVGNVAEEEEIRRIVEGLPGAEVPWPEEKIQGLVTIGFERHEAVAALNATDGNVDLAAGFLFDHR